jgi:hypothetical protein
MVRAPFRWAIAAMAGLFTLPLLAGLWHVCRFAAPAERGDYHLTSFLTNCFSVFFFGAVFVVCVAAGWLTRFMLTYALMLIVPFPIALLIEVSEDPSSHNLLPFEIVFAWIPILLLAVSGVLVGRYARRRAA